MLKNQTSIIILQLVLFFYLFLSGPVVPQNIFAFLFEGAGFLLALWSLLTMRTTSYKITPEIATGAVLVENGPYTYVRHPMYFAVVLITLGLLLNYFTLVRGLAVIVLIMDLLKKIDYEENLLRGHFKKYEEYKNKTKKLIPFFY